jgi:hypothetical protein
MNCWLRLKRHDWGMWMLTLSDLPPPGYHAWVGKCARCGALRCQLLRGGV